MESSGERGAEDKARIGNEDRAASGAGSKDNGGLRIGNTFGNVNEGGANRLTDGSVGGEETGLVQEGGEDLGEGEGRGVGKEGKESRTVGGIEKVDDFGEGVCLSESFVVDTGEAGKRGKFAERRADIFFRCGVGGEDGGGEARRGGACVEMGARVRGNGRGGQGSDPSEGKGGMIVVDDRRGVGRGGGVEGTSCIGFDSEKGIDIVDVVGRGAEPLMVDKSKAGH